MCTRSIDQEIVSGWEGKEKEEVIDGDLHEMGEVKKKSEIFPFPRLSSSLSVSVFFF